MAARPLSRMRPRRVFPIKPELEPATHHTKPMPLLFGEIEGSIFADPSLPPPQSLRENRNNAG